MLDIVKNKEVFMKRIKLDKLSDIIINDTYPDYFMGYSTTKHRDINGVEYELKNKEQKYCLLGVFHDSKIFVSEDHLLHTLLLEDIDSIESGDIYSHGYPESRLIPSNHYEECQKYFLERIHEDIAEKVDNAISHYFH